MKWLLHTGLEVVLVQISSRAFGAMERDLETRDLGAIPATQKHEFLQQIICPLWASVFCSIDEGVGRDFKGPFLLPYAVIL